MQISELRDELSAGLRSFLWGQWSQLGVMAQSDRHDGWATDPEALILTTLEAGRDEPRLFDELLDWLQGNERLVSVQRLRNLSADAADRALLEGTLAWLAQSRPKVRAGRVASRGDVGVAEPEPLFTAAITPFGEPDPAFLRAGLLRDRVQSRGHSRHPDLSQPIAFAFRLRQMLGTSARAEVVRALLTTEAPRLPAQVIAASAGYTKRNVHEALTALGAARVIDTVTLGNERRYGIDKGRWATLLDIEPDRLPLHRDWPQHFEALRTINRWLRDPGRLDESDYRRASDARVLMDRVAPMLRYAGVPTSEGGIGTEYWNGFRETALNAVSALGL